MISDIRNRVFEKERSRDELMVELDRAQEAFVAARNRVIESQGGLGQELEGDCVAMCGVVRRMEARRAEMSTELFNQARAFSRDMREISIALVEHGGIKFDIGATVVSQVVKALKQMRARISELETAKEDEDRQLLKAYRDARATIAAVRNAVDSYPMDLVEFMDRLKAADEPKGYNDQKPQAQDERFQIRGWNGMPPGGY